MNVSKEPSQTPKNLIPIPCSVHYDSSILGIALTEPRLPASPYVDPRMGLRQAHDARRASAQEPANARQGYPRTRPGPREAREAGEDPRRPDQAECPEGPDGSRQDPGEGPGSHKKVCVAASLEAD